MIRHRLSSLSTAVVLGVLAGTLVGLAEPAAAATTVVEPGQTLWEIAASNRMTVSELAAANAMHEGDLLVAGRRLQMPAMSQAHRVIQAAPLSQPRRTAPPLNAPSRMAAAPVARAVQPLPHAVAPPRPALTPAQLAQQRNFCAHVAEPLMERRGSLPALLISSPGRLALRPHFRRWAQAYGVPAALVQAVAWQESGWQIAAVSSAGAVGVGQLMPDTAAFVSGALLGLKLKSTVPEDNIRMSARLLAHLLAATRGNTCEAVASYYQGLDTLRRAGVLLETQPYVKNVLALVGRFA